MMLGVDAHEAEPLRPVEHAEPGMRKPAVGGEQGIEVCTDVLKLAAAAPERFR